jgi:hypothetical protein
LLITLSVGACDWTIAFGCSRPERPPFTGPPSRDKCYMAPLRASLLVEMYIYCGFILSSVDIEGPRNHGGVNKTLNNAFIYNIYKLFHTVKKCTFGLYLPLGGQTIGRTMSIMRYYLHEVNTNNVSVTEVIFLTSRIFNKKVLEAQNCANLSIFHYIIVLVFSVVKSLEE